MTDILEPGMKVECIADLSLSCGFGEDCPAVGGIYTVRELFASRGREALRLIEVVNQPLQYKGGFMECGFAIRAFRPIRNRSTDITIFRELVTPANLDKFVDDLVDA